MGRVLQDVHSHISVFYFVMNGLSIHYWKLEESGQMVTFKVFMIFTKAIGFVL